MCEKNSNQHIKTIFKVSDFISYNTCHDVNVKEHCTIKSTDGKIISGPFNFNGDISVIQLNHYKCKTLEEFKYIRGLRQRADIKEHDSEDVDILFRTHDRNEVLGETAFRFFANLT